MVSSENKPKKRRKHEKKNLLEAWEGCEANHGPKDDIFYGSLKAKQVKQKCRYLDERNIMVSHHLLSDPLCFDPEERDVAGDLSPRWDTSHDNVLAAKSDALLVDPRSLSQTVPDTASVSTNGNTITDLMIHKRNISYALSPVRTRISDLKRSLPLIRWAPATYCVQVVEEPVAWRCKGLAPVNHEAKPAGSPHLWKRAFGWRREQCRGGLASLARPEEQSPSTGLSAAQTRARGRSGNPVEQSFLWTPLAKGAGLWYEDSDPLPRSDPVLRAHKKAKGSHVQSTMQDGSKKQQEQDGGHRLHRKQGDVSLGCSNTSILDMLCHSGCQGNSESSTISCDVTFFHILQVLQSEPASLPEARVVKRHKLLQRVNA